MSIPESVDCIEIMGHLWPMVRGRNEPFEAERCLRCGVSYAGTGPAMTQCPHGNLDKTDVKSAVEHEKRCIIIEIDRRLEIIEEVDPNTGGALKRLRDAIQSNKHRS